MMRRSILVVVLLALVALSLSAQSWSFDVYKDSFQAFSDAVAEALPFNATIGLDWSSAYVGQLPHFGIGLTAGASSLPYEAVKTTFSDLDIALPSELEQLKDYGVPFPAAALNARLGGFFLPFDIGFKAGFIPPEALSFLPYPMDYLMLGGDVRVPLLKGKGLLPALSVGAGYTYLRGSVAVPDAIAGGSVNMTDFMNNMGYSGSWNIGVTDPDVAFAWQTHVIEAKAQVSKSLFIITPYLGIGAAYGISQAGGGLTGAEVTRNGSPISAQDIADIQAAFADAGYEAPEISAEGFLLSSGVRGWAVRAFGGLSFNLLILKLDLTGGYNFTSDSYSLAANARIQI